ncbi:MAG TPA: hypothetical protein VM619_14885 [Luteimonas sp.]|nr:hypothetical protein [Luteimonas sp.]
MIVTHSHFRTIPARAGSGYCNRGGRAWFERHGLDWSDFVHNGIDESALLSTGDGLAIKLVEWARQSEAEARARG